MAQQAQQFGIERMKPSLDLQLESVRRAKELADAPWQTPDPQFGFHYAKNPVLHALEAFLAATGPGQRIEEAMHGGGRAARAAEMRTRAQEIESLTGSKGVSGAAAEPLSAEAGLTYHPMMAAASGVRAEAATERNKIMEQHYKDVAANFVATRDLRGAALDERKRADFAREAQQAADESGRNWRETYRDATMEEVAGIVAGTKKEIANEAAAKDPSVKAWLFNALGIDVPQVQGAPSPEFRGTPKASTKPPTAKGGTKKYVSGGVKYNIPAEQEQEFLKDHPNARLQ